jgi:hypothetical protein
MGWEFQDQKVGRTGRELEADNILGGCACPRLSLLSQWMHAWLPVMAYHRETNMTLEYLWFYHRGVFAPTPGLAQTS